MREEEGGWRGLERESEIEEEALQICRGLEK